MFCFAVLSPITIFVQTVIKIIRRIVETVCDWVSSILTYVIEVLNKVCKKLPWPLSLLCKWVTSLVTVVKVVWNWVCEVVVRFVIDLIETIVTYVIYILKWICWVVDWIPRSLELLLCRAGITPRKYIGVCIKILAEDVGNPVISISAAMDRIERARTVLENCNITLEVCGIEVLIKPEYVTGTICDPKAMLNKSFTWFTSNSCDCCSMLTIYFVESMPDVSGCAYPGTDWIRVNAVVDGTVIVHELGHLSDLWQHSNDPNNVMASGSKGTHDQVTSMQCCMIRTSRFAKLRPQC